MTRLLAALMAGSLLFALAGPSPAAETYATFDDLRLLGEDAGAVDAGVGSFGFDTSEGVAALFTQWRGGRKLAFIGPVAGVMATADSDLYGYVGLYGDLVWKRLAITPQWGFGAYHQGAGKDLGGAFQFRSALTLAWRFPGEARLGAQVAHISNADLYTHNPGANEIYLTFGFPFRFP